MGCFECEKAELRIEVVSYFDAENSSWFVFQSAKR